MIHLNTTMNSLTHPYQNSDATHTSSLKSITVLIVEDCKPEQLLMQAMLSKFGYSVATADNGNQALKILETQDIQMIISDWRMPELTGIDLCRQVRSDPSLGLPYIIMVTGRNTKADLIAGMEAGADDFISKPFNSEELRVRLQAGTRILALRDTTEQRNIQLTRALQREAKTNQSIQRDLDSAARMQQMQLPSNHSLYDQLEIAWLFQPASTVAGDNFNYFRLDDDHLGFYLLDVAGHGIASAMLSFTVSHLMLPGMGVIPQYTERPSIQRSKGQHQTCILQPNQVITALNQRFIEKDDCTHYFTMVFGVLNVNSGKGRLCQAGHPHPLVVNELEGVRQIGQGGFPVGMLKDATYDNVDFTLSRGERLFLYSDGITDIHNPDGAPFSTNRLTALLNMTSSHCITAVADFVDMELKRWHCNSPLDDDISLLAIGRKLATTGNKEKSNML